MELKGIIIVLTVVLGLNDSLAKPQEADTDVEYTFHLPYSPSASAATYEGKAASATTGPNYVAALAYGGVVISILVLIAHLMGITVFSSVSDSVAKIAERYDIGLAELRQGVDTVRRQIRGRNLPLDDSTLDAITNVVMDAIDAYEGFNDVRN